MSFGLWSLQTMSQLAWSVDVNEFRALAGISQSGGGRNAHRGTNLPQYDHRVKRWRGGLRC